MKRLLNKRLVVAVFTIACLTTVLLIVAPIRSSSPVPGEYDPWLDWNDDGKIDMKDIGRAAKAYGTNGTSVSKASIDYESDWINITDKCGQNIVITHNLNSTDLIVDIQGKTALDSGPHQRNYGLTTYTPGWSRTYGGTGNDITNALVQTSDGGYALAGETYSFGAGNADFWLVKTDASGTAQWNQTYGGTSDDVADALVQTRDGGYALAGYPNSNSSMGVYADFWLVKTDASGNAQWNQTYGGAGVQEARGLVQTTDGGYALAGWTAIGRHDQTDVLLVKTDASGYMQWNKTYGSGTRWDQAFALVQTTDGGYTLAGRTSSFGAGSYDFWLVKTDVESGLGWVDSSANTITLYRGATDTYWNYVRVRLWKPR